MTDEFGVIEDNGDPGDEDGLPEIPTSENPAPDEGDVGQLDPEDIP